MGTSLLLVVCAAASEAPRAEAPALPAQARIRSAISPYLELHNFLMVSASSDAEPRPEYLSQIHAYKEAKEMAKDRLVWQLIYDACVEGPDIGAIQKRGENLPSSLAPADREAAKKLFEALVAAWPRFESTDLVDRNRSLQSILVKVLRHTYSLLWEEKIMSALFEKMQFKPLDAPVTIYPVIDAVEAGAWGKTSQGYYLVIPVRRQPSPVIIEGLVHELTHLLDVNQPSGSTDLLKQLRQKAAAADPATLDAFVHGLVAFNAGEMVRRYGNPNYKPLLEISQTLRAQIEPYLPSLNGPWTGYLDGKLTAEQAIDGMVAGLKTAAPKAVADKPAASSRR